MMSYEEFCEHVDDSYLLKYGMLSLKVSTYIPIETGVDKSTYVKDCKKLFYDSLFGGNDKDLLADMLVRNGELRTELKMAKDEIESLRDKISNATEG